MHQKVLSFQHVCQQINLGLRSIVWSKCRNNMHPGLIFLIPHLQAIVNYQRGLWMAWAILEDIEQRLFQTYYNIIVTRELLKVNEIEVAETWAYSPVQ